jgi:hypothetical protein
MKLAASQAMHDACFMLVCCLDYSSTLKTEATCSSETSVDFQWTKRRYIPDDTSLHNNRCENLKADISFENVAMFTGSENESHR